METGNKGELPQNVATPVGTAQTASAPPGSLTLARRVMAEERVKSSCSKLGSSRYFTRLIGIGTGTLGL